MDFELTEEQVLLAEIARDFVDAECPPSVPRAVIDRQRAPQGPTEAGTGGWQDLWKSIVGLEWPGLAVDVDHGGSGATAVELALVIEELGRGADPTPFLATTSQYGPMIAEAFGPHDDSVGGDLLAAVCDGVTGAVAFTADPAVDEQVTAVAADDGWRVSGTASTVIDGDRADRIAVVADTPDGPGVFVVDAGDVTATRTPSFDASLHVAEVHLDDVAVASSHAATGPDTADAIERARHVALCGIAAGTVGACQRILDLVLDHVKGRKQFGVPIGSFQAVKHMAVDMYVAVERARALVQFAALTIAENDPRRAIAASMAKAAAGDAQRLAAQHGIQLFGGLGYTWENDLQIFVRRAKAGELLLGGSAQHRAAVARATLARLTQHKGQSR